MQQQKAKLVNNHRKMANHYTKRTRVSTKTKRVPRQARRQGSHTKKTSDSNTPSLIPCSLRGPDGQVRPGWELRIGEILFGRADSKESLLQYYARIHEPMPSGHWRERSWQPQQRNATARRARQTYETYD